MTHRYFVAPVLALALLSAACADRQPLAPPTAPSQVARAEVALVNGVQEVRGFTGEGALYGLFVPEDWNGSLVLFAHGILDWDKPLMLEMLPSIAELRDSLNHLGNAVAYSSYSYNGWNVSDGAERTHQLVGLFTARFQRPTRVYLIGSSMGSLVALKLAETHPEQYAGVLAEAGFLGGGLAFIDYYFNIRLLFDFYYPGVLPGSVVEPPVISTAELLARAQAAMTADFSGATRLAEAMAAIDMPLAVRPGAETRTLTNIILIVLGQVNDRWDMMVAYMHGHLGFDNRATNYVIPNVQENIPRIAGDPDARNYMQRNYQPDGRLRMPLVTMDAEWDPIAPLWHKDRYEHLLEQTGAADLMYRMTVPEFGHGPKSIRSALAAFRTLAAWVETGQRP